MKVYYNEIDKKKCAALKALMEDGHISKGDIDDRPIQEVSADDVRGYDRAHFFAGIGVWDSALTLAGEPTDRIIWSGSCPCQPYSSAGLRQGKEDDRDLWPYWSALIRECKPDTVYGEQADEAAWEGWLETVCRDLELSSYAVAPFILPGYCAGAPHERYRLWFAADAQGITRIYKPDDQETEKRLHNDKTYWQTNPWDASEPTFYPMDDVPPFGLAVIHFAGDAIIREQAAEFIKAYRECVT